MAERVITDAITAVGRCRIGAGAKVFMEASAAHGPLGQRDLCYI